MKLNDMLSWVKQTAIAWQKDKCPRFGAALAFYSVLSTGPLLVIFLTLGHFFFATETLSGHLVYEMKNLIGRDGADAMSIIITGSQPVHDQGLLVTVISLSLVILGASALFGELQDALNIIWNVPTPKYQSWIHAIREKFLSFVMVLGSGLFLLVTLALTNLFNTMAKYMDLHTALSAVLWLIVNWGVFFAMITVLFALIFKILPDVRVYWKDVIPAAVITSVLFNLGKLLIGLYLEHSSIRSMYGAAGSLAILLIWIYYSAQIFYFGAELCKTHAALSGKNKPTPTDTVISTS